MLKLLATFENKNRPKKLKWINNQNIYTNQTNYLNLNLSVIIWFWIIIFQNQKIIFKYRIMRKRGFTSTVIKTLYTETPQKIKIKQALESLVLSLFTHLKGD